MYHTLVRAGKELGAWRRGMVKVDSSGSPIRDAKGHVQPSIDYPYAQDGLQIWYAMKEWFGAYLRLYYDDTVGSGKQARSATLAASAASLLQPRF